MTLFCSCFSLILKSHILYIWISFAAFDKSIFEVVTYWSRRTFSFMWIFKLTNDICITYYDIYQDLVCFHCLDIWFGYGYLNYLRNIWFIIVDIWSGKPIITKIPIVNKLDLVTFSVVNLNIDIIKCTVNREKRSLDTIHHYELDEAHQQEKQIV